MEDTTRLTNEPSIKLFIQRDYSEGTAVKFQERFPSELQGKVKMKRNHIEKKDIPIDYSSFIRSIQKNLHELFEISMKSMLKLKLCHVKPLWRIVVLA